MCTTEVKYSFSLPIVSKPLKLCDRILTDNPLSDSTSTAMLHFSLVLPSQTRLLFFVEGIFAVVVGGALVAGFCSV